MECSLILAAVQNNMISQVILILAVGLVFYFFTVRPQQKKQKEQKGFVENIKSGSQVVTIGGLHGKISEVDNSKGLVTIIIDEKGSKITVDKSAISIEASRRYLDKEKEVDGQVE